MEAKQLADYETAELEAEIVRRFQRILKGECSYCGRRPGAPGAKICKYPDRHKLVKRIAKA